MQNTFYIEILGCQYNYYDAKNITHQMIKMGYIYDRDEHKADIIIVISCSVRQKPIDRIFGKIKNWNRENKKIIIMGCVLPHDKKILETRVDLITNADNFKKDIVKLLSYQIEKNKYSNNKSVKQICNIEFFPVNELDFTSYVPIMQGCNNFCTYCAVPYTRGRETSRDVEVIIKEIKREIHKGKKYIILLGQNVNNYKLHGEDSKNNNLKNCNINSDFAKLLKKIDEINGKFKYNFISSNPKNFSKELIDFLPNAKKWNKHLHLPLQSGNNMILKKMNRGYTIKDYLKIIKSLRPKITNLKLTTDIIVGFPSETKKQFHDTMKICEKIGFNGAYVNQYSPRTGTLAQKKYEDDIPRIEKKLRWEKLNKLINK